MRRVVAIGLVILAVAGCGGSKAAITRVQDGMTKGQVRDIMGQPIHVERDSGGVVCWGWGKRHPLRINALVCFNGPRSDDRAYFIVGKGHLTP